jgi:hypothetical protein
VRFVILQGHPDAARREKRLARLRALGRDGR